MVKARAKGKLFAGIVGSGIDCYVLEDEQRVIHVGGITRAIGAAEKGGIARYLRGIGAESLMESMRSMEVSLPGGGVATCYPAKFLLDVCKAYRKAGADGKLKEKQAHLARQAGIVLDACAEVGITALIDEATEYQKVRTSDALQRLLAEIVRREASPWQRRWTEAFKAITRLYRRPWDGTGSPPRWLSGVVHWVYRVVLGEEVTAELKRMNPDPQFGSNHHQYLASAPQQILEEDLRVIELLAKQSATSSEWRERVEAHFKRLPFQLKFGDS